VKHGEWVNERELAGGFRSIWGYDCSVCGHTVENYQTNYCPNCGAKMKEHYNVEE
jgi:rubrerythrin